MKTDWKLLTAILIVIGLVIGLIFLTLERERSVERRFIELQERINAQPKVAAPAQVKTPILGIDYFNGQDGQSIQGPKGDSVQGPRGNDGARGESAYQIAVRNGFKGTEAEWLESQKVKGDKGDAAPILEMDCIDGRLTKKYSVDKFWQPLNVKCEAVDG